MAWLLREQSIEETTSRGTITNRNIPARLLRGFVIDGLIIGLGLGLDLGRVVCGRSLRLSGVAAIVLGVVCAFLFSSESKRVCQSVTNQVLGSEVLR